MVSWPQSFWLTSLCNKINKFQTNVAYRYKFKEAYILPLTQTWFKEKEQYKPASRHILVHFYAQSESSKSQEDFNVIENEDTRAACCGQLSTYFHWEFTHYRRQHSRTGWLLGCNDDEQQVVYRAPFRKRNQFLDLMPHRWLKSVSWCHQQSKQKGSHSVWDCSCGCTGTYVFFNLI